MPESNCAIFECLTFRKQNIITFKVPRKNDKYSIDWKKNVNVITRYSVIDKGLQS